MSNYRRLRIPGATYFFTVRLQNRSSGLLLSRGHDLRAAYAATIRDMPIKCNAMVVLPDHLHAVWTLPPDDSAFPERWRKIKARFSHAVGSQSRAVSRSSSKRMKRECGVWQRRFWEHVIRNQADFQRHLAYCWTDPVRHGLVERAADWPHSSIQREIRAGRMPVDWSGDLIEGRFGE